MTHITLICKDSQATFLPLTQVDLSDTPDANNTPIFSLNDEIASPGFLEKTPQRSILPTLEECERMETETPKQSAENEGPDGKTDEENKPENLKTPSKENEAKEGMDQESTSTEEEAETDKGKPKAKRKADQETTEKEDDQTEPPNKRKRPNDKGRMSTNTPQSPDDSFDENTTLAELRSRPVRDSTRKQTEEMREKTKATKRKKGAIEASPRPTLQKLPTNKKKNKTDEGNENQSEEAEKEDKTTEKSTDSQEKEKSKETKENPPKETAVVNPFAKRTTIDKKNVSF